MSDSGISSSFQFLFHYSKARNSVGAVQKEVRNKVVVSSSSRLKMFVVNDAPASVAIVEKTDHEASVGNRQAEL